MNDSSTYAKYQDRPDDAEHNLTLPPHSIEAEQAVIGSLMLSEHALDTISETVSDRDFYRPEHRLIFAAIMHLVQESIPVDLVTLSTELERRENLERVGGLAYLSELAANLPSITNISAYANIVRERALLRQLISAATDINSAAFHPDGRDALDILDEAEQKVFAIAEARTADTGPQAINPIIKSAVARLEQLNELDGALTGLSTGLTELDKKTAGLQPADLIIIAGRPSMGKTALGMNIAEHIALTSDAPTLIFSLEMPTQQLMMRMLASLGKIDQTLFRSGNLKTDDWGKLIGASNLLRDRPMFIDDTPSLTPLDIRTRARRIAREHGNIGLIMVDYLQLMQVKGANEGRTAEISAISRSLKAIAKEMNCPVVALSQLNRNLEMRPDKRPINSDLRESGAIEQDADLIIFIYRDEVYNPDSEDRGIAEIIIGKQRNGPIGTVKTAFVGKYSHFKDLTQNYEDVPIAES